jgi:hypothetical protein
MAAPDLNCVRLVANKNFGDVIVSTSRLRQARVVKMVRLERERFDQNLGFASRISAVFVPRICTESIAKLPHLILCGAIQHPSLAASVPLIALPIRHPWRDPKT